MPLFCKLNVVAICCFVGLYSSALAAQQGNIISPPTTIPQLIPQPIPQFLPQPTFPSTQIQNGPAYRPQITPSPIVDNQGRIIQNPVVPPQINSDQVLPGIPIAPPVTQPAPKVPGPEEQEQEDLRTTLERARKTISTLRTQNEELNQRMQTLVTERDAATAEIAKLKKMPATPDNAEAIAQLQQQIQNLNNQTQTLTNEGQTLRDTIGQLSEQNSQLKLQLDNQGMDDGELAKIQAALNTRTREVQEAATQLAAKSEELDMLNARLKPLEGQIQQLSEQNAQLKLQLDNQGMGDDELAEIRAALDARTREVQAATAELATKSEELDMLNARFKPLEGQNQQLNETIAALTGERSELQNQIAAFASGSEPSEAAEIMAEPAETITVTRADPELLAKLDRLTKENRRLKNSFSEAEDRNRSLRRELNELEEDNETLLASETELDIDSDVAERSDSALTLPSIGADADGDSDAYNINYWILPFLLLGLGIALFVVLREEFHKKPAERLVSGREDKK